MSSSKPTQDAPRINIFNYRKLWMEGPRVNGSERPSTFHFDIFKGNPRCVVYYNDDKTDPVIARMEIDSFLAVLDLMEGLADGSLPGKMYKVECKHSFRGEEKLPKPEVINKVIVGLDKEDRMYITVVQDGLEPIIFTFTNNFWYMITDKDNNPVDESLLSRVLARSKAKLVRKLLAVVLHSSTDEIEEERKRRAEEWKAKMPERGQRKPNGGYNRSSSGQPASRPSTPAVDDSFDDDLTF